jgi:hypothetical protein
MTEPEGGFSSTGLAAMFDKMVHSEDERSEGWQGRPLMNLVAVTLVFCTCCALVSRIKFSKTSKKGSSKCSLSWVKLIHKINRQHAR